MLENKLGITNSAELAREEERISKTKASVMFESGFLDTLEAGTVFALCEIHRFLFCDIYDFAGKLRTVNISNEKFRFASVMYLEEALTAVEKMPQSSFDEIIEKYVEMNIAHPFREGNGRSMRIWLDLMLKASLGKVTDWNSVDKESYLAAMEHSPVSDRDIKAVIASALTDRISDRDTFMKGIDNSYYYEGYTAYSTARLSELHNKINRESP